jgi:hypothetical protein
MALQAIRPHPSDEQAPPPASTTYSTRKRTIGENLTRAYLLAGRDLPNPRSEEGRKLWMLTVEAWEIGLADIPDHRLDEAFTRAIRNHREPFLLGHDAVIRAYDELKQETLAYRNQAPAPVAGYLPSGEPEPYYNIAPLVAELKAWAKLLGWWQDAPPDPEMPQQLADPKMALLLRYAVAIRRFYQQSPADCAEFVREMATALVADNPQIDFDFVLLEVHGFDELPAVQPARECKVCHGMKHVALVDRGLERAPSAIGTMPCPKCGGR